MAQRLTAIALMGGVVHNFPTELSIQQSGEPDLSFTARYRTRPLDDPFYYVLKLSLKMLNHDWEIQLIHHKLYLTNPPPEVQHFEVTHGFNILTLNRVFQMGRFRLPLGLGAVLPHAESEIRHRKYQSRGGFLNLGYRISGPVLLAGVGREFPLGKRLKLVLEVQFIGGRARVPIAGGEARLSNVALHGLLGLEAGL
ncbi:MAG: hypothetical protein Kow0042_24670 [Calditrichia bacterium]